MFERHTLVKEMLNKYDLKVFLNWKKCLFQLVRAGRLSADRELHSHGVKQGCSRGR